MESSIRENARLHRFGLPVGDGLLAVAHCRKAILKCPFMARFFARHSEYAGVVEG
ncbi:MAG: hypothetical protein AB7S92_02520 [Parvibaculaceae bacterium]